MNEIQKKCVGCSHGFANHVGRGVQCKHHLHPGNVGGFGTEWALNCSHYTPDGKRGTIEVRLVRKS